MYNKSKQLLQNDKRTTRFESPEKRSFKVQVAITAKEAIPLYHNELTAQQIACIARIDS